MTSYILRRLLLLPITLFLILLTNFAIVNLAPGEPTSMVASEEGKGSHRGPTNTGSQDDLRMYLRFREYYGLTLPILWNRWAAISDETVRESLNYLATAKGTGDSSYRSTRTTFGDQARYIMPKLLAAAEDSALPLGQRILAMQFFARGALRQPFVGPNLSDEQRAWNKETDISNRSLDDIAVTDHDTEEQLNQKLILFKQWYIANKDVLRFEPTGWEQTKIFFGETRLYRYLSRVLTLDFGTLRLDDNKTVVAEVTKRFKISLTLAVFPMLITFALCLLFGFVMAVKQNGVMDMGLNLVFLILYAIPIFVVAPLLMEWIASNHNIHYPFTDHPFPNGGFNSDTAIYSNFTAKERLWDIVQHITLPLIAILYHGLAAQSRLGRTAVLEVLRQDYVRTARAKGLSRFTILFKHVGRNSAITIVSSIAGSLGVILGGSLFVETMFEIDGFGKFFYNAIQEHDYNVIMFSALAGSFLTLIGYLLADIAYTVLDPRVTLD